MTEDQLEEVLEAGLAQHRTRIRERQRDLESREYTEPGYIESLIALADAASTLLKAEEQIPQQLRAHRRRSCIRLARAAGALVFAVPAALVVDHFLGGRVGWISTVLLIVLALSGAALLTFAGDVPDITVRRARAGALIAGAAAPAATAASFGTWPVALYLAAAATTAIGWSRLGLLAETREAA